MADHPKRSFFLTDRACVRPDGSRPRSRVPHAGNRPPSTNTSVLTVHFYTNVVGTLQSIAEPWADTTSPAGRMVLTVFAGIAEFERSLIATRTEEGRRAAQARGVPFGRPPKLRPDQRTLARHLIDEGKSVSEVARTFNVHVATIYRCLHDEAPL